MVETAVRGQPSVGRGLRRSAPPSRSAVREGLLLAAVLMVIVGIIGMHAISSGHHLPSAASVAAPAQSPADDAEYHAAALLSPHSTVVEAGSAVVLECGPECARAAGTGAVCLVALTVLLILKRPRRSAHRLPRPAIDRRLTRLVGLLAHRPAPRPPSLSCLCALRI